MVTYAALLDRFFAWHFPLRPASTQYRSAVFYAGDAERDEAVAARARVSHAYGGRRIFTEVRPLERFFRAEDYHQKYYLRRHPALMRAFARYDARQFADSIVACRLNAYVAGAGDAARLARELPALGLPDDAAEQVRQIVARAGGVFCG